MDATLTVTIPAHDAAGTVATAVRSTARSLPSDGRILVLDDASTDETATVVSAMAASDRRIRLIRNTGTALGVAAASNALLDEVDTAFVARVDADDISLPGRIGRQMRTLAAGDADLVAVSGWFYGPSRWALEPVPMLSADPDSVRWELLLNCPFIHSGIAATTSAMRSVGGYQAVPSEDWDLYMRLAVEGARLRRLARPGVLYRRSATQMSAQGWWKDALRADEGASASHRRLCADVVGRDCVAYPALCGPGATPDQVADARELVRLATDAAAGFPPPQRISLKITAGGLGKRLDGWYGAPA
ncbi:MAG: glycosyltransferase family 2 protein [Gordonia paraffinivorans]